MKNEDFMRQGWFGVDLGDLVPFGGHCGEPKDAFGRTFCFLGATWVPLLGHLGSLGVPCGGLWSPTWAHWVSIWSHSGPTGAIWPGTP